METRILHSTLEDKISVVAEGARKGFGVVEV